MAHESKIPGTTPVPTNSQRKGKCDAGGMSEREAAALLTN